MFYTFTMKQKYLKCFIFYTEIETFKELFYCFLKTKNLVEFIKKFKFFFIISENRSSGPLFFKI